MKATQNAIAHPAEIGQWLKSLLEATWGNPWWDRKKSKCKYMSVNEETQPIIWQSMRFDCFGMGLSLVPKKSYIYRTSMADDGSQTSPEWPRMANQNTPDWGLSLWGSLPQWGQKASMHFSALEGAPENLRNASIPDIWRNCWTMVTQSSTFVWLLHTDWEAMFWPMNPMNPKALRQLSCFRICINFFFDKSFFNKDLIRCLDMPKSLFV